MSIYGDSRRHSYVTIVYSNRKLGMETTMKTVIPSKIARAALLCLAPQSTPYHPRSHPPAQFCATKKVEIRFGSFEAIGGFPQLHSTRFVLYDVFRGPSRYDGRNSRLSASISAPGRISPSSSSHTYSNDGGVMTASFLVPFSPGGFGRVAGGGERSGYFERVGGWR